MSKEPMTRRYTDEFKRDAVALYRSSGRPIKHVAQELGISDTALGTASSTGRCMVPVMMTGAHRHQPMEATACQVHHCPCSNARRSHSR